MNDFKKFLGLSSRIIIYLFVKTAMQLAKIPHLFEGTQRITRRDPSLRNCRVIITFSNILVTSKHRLKPTFSKQLHPINLLVH